MVSLTSVAFQEGFAVKLSSNNPKLVVPSSVKVASGQTAASFTATAREVSIDQAAIITAGSGSMTTSVTLNLVAPVQLAGLACSPTALSSGTASTCTVSLNKTTSIAAVVALGSNNSIVTVPAIVTVLVGESTANFEVIAGNVSSSQTAIITAVFNEVNQSATISLNVPTSASAGAVVFVIAMGSHNWVQPISQTSPSQVYGNPAAPYINSLVTPGDPNAAQVSYASNYQNVAAGIHPSEPNYIWAEAGSNLGVFNDNDPFSPGGAEQSTNQSLGNFLQTFGRSWKSYQEDADISVVTGLPLAKSLYTVPLSSQSGNFTSGMNPYNASYQYNYAAKHNPMLFFTSTSGGKNPNPTNRLAANYAPLQQLLSDLSGNTVARYNWITPDQYNDQHTALNGGFTYNGKYYTGDAANIAQGDSFLSILVPQIMASPAYKNNGTIIIWWDESEGGDDPGRTLGEIVISPLAKGNAYTNNIFYTHSSDLLTMQEIFGVGTCLRDACRANDLSDLFLPGSIPSAAKLQVSNTTLVYPGTANVSVCVTQATNTPATGIVRILDGINLVTDLLATLPLEGNGCANWYIKTGLTARTHALTAVYSGDSNNPPSTSNEVTVQVNPAPAYLSASCGNASFPFGYNYNCNVNVGSNAGSAAGTITYTFDGGAPVSLPLTNGSAQFSLVTPNAGPHTVVIAYAQQGNFAAAGPSTQNFTVAPALTQVQLTPSNYHPAAGRSFTLSASVTTYSDSIPGSGTVTFFDNGAPIGTGTVNAQGRASLTIASLPAAGYHSYQAQFGGTSNFVASTSGHVTISAR